jgi:hypothetical protein
MFPIELESLIQIEERPVREEDGHADRTTPCTASSNLNEVAASARQCTGSPPVSYEAQSWTRTV